VEGGSMHNIDLFEMARTKLIHKPTDERFIYDATCWAEKRVPIFMVKHYYDDLLNNDTMPDFLQDYCIAVLNGAKPLNFTYQRRNK